MLYTEPHNEKDYLLVHRFLLQSKYMKKVINRIFKKFCLTFRIFDQSHC